jgi:DNA-binding protein HU-beta
MTKKSTKAPAKKAAATKAAPVKAAASEKAEANKIAKAGLVDAVAEQTDLTRVQSDAVVTAVLEGLVAAVREGKSVTLNGVGTFSVRATAARTGVRPGTTEKIQIPAGKKLGFKVSSTLKSSL